MNINNDNIAYSRTCQNLTQSPTHMLTDTPLRNRRTATMNKDSCHTQIHLHSPRYADLFEDFCSPHARLPDDEVYVPPHHQPINPEDEDDVVPDQHAAFGIQRATQKTRESAWRDLGLGELMGKGPGEGSRAAGGAVGGGKRKGGSASGLPR
ncbi:Apc13p protein-domain-containing protein [Truncatella angustata]|uniref:Apc13p protein-domain-containing protein n=1 Tax=Truncatella angustata TaxID=152316 RepID=A0A9P8UFM6_9PEZI|nr:Apc13p protein-domain-containing protein [Truncatella angustata]KAH6649034.1 Apc13p protein-domain-containing protein [Truncatella angustata]KAH8201784.1 hypothetical protein TruAng_004048 [Truncatella angustata]